MQTDEHLAAVARASQQADASLAERDRTIRAAHRHGLSLRQIGNAAGLSHEGIRKIALGRVPERT